MPRETACFFFVSDHRPPCESEREKGRKRNMPLHILPKFFATYHPPALSKEVIDHWARMYTTHSSSSPQVETKVTRFLCWFSCSR